MKLLTIVQLLTIAVFVLFSTLSDSMYTNNRNPTLDEQWSIYKTKFNKMHTNLEDITRRAIWEENLKKIQNHNLEADLGMHTYHLGMNDFGDWSHEEYKASLIPAVHQNRNVSRKAVNQNQDSLTILPESFDWSGNVTSVKRQGRSCYSSAHHAAVAIFESAHFIKFKTLKEFSVQQMLDCVDHYGCRGMATVDDILKYIKTKGIQEQKNFPYLGKSSTCKKSDETYTAYATEVGHIKEYDELEMRQALIKNGPITAYIDGRSFGFKFYFWGIFNYRYCSKTYLSNVVAIVGYGKEAWRIKNSFGKVWGLGGYAWVAIDVNACGIATDTMYVRA